MRALQMATELAVFMAAAMVFGCATISGPTPAEEAAAALADYVTAAESQNIDDMMASFSDDYRNEQGVTKAMLRQQF